MDGLGLCRASRELLLSVLICTAASAGDCNIEVSVFTPLIAGFSARPLPVLSSAVLWRAGIPFGVGTYSDAP